MYQATMQAITLSSREKQPQTFQSTLQYRAPAANIQDPTKCELVYTHYHTIHDMVAVAADTTDLPLASHTSLPTSSSTDQYYHTQRLIKNLPTVDVVSIPAIGLSLAAT